MLTPSDLTQEQLLALLSNKDAALDQLDKEESELSLRDFVRHHWNVLEPGRRLAWGWALDAICEHLEAVTAGEIRKLLINVPPGMMKSLLTNVFWSAWEWGPKNRPQHRYVSAAYSQDLTVRDNRRCRTLMESAVYRRRWGDRFRLTDDQNAKTLYSNDKTGFRLATSTGGVGTGERGDRIVIDDPHNVKGAESPVKREETLAWFTETMPTRATDPHTAAFIVIMQRLHERDVSGLILEAELGYVHLCLPMEFEPERRCYTILRPRGAPAAPVSVAYTSTLKRLADAQQLADCLNDSSGDALREELCLPKPSPEDPPFTADDVRNLADVDWKTAYPWDLRWDEGELLLPDRFPLEEVEDLKKQLRAWGGAYAEAGQLQQRPAPRGGGMFKQEDFHVVREGPPPQAKRVRGWDFAGSEKKRSAYTCGAKLSEWRGLIFIESIVRGRWSPADFNRRLKSTAIADGRSVPIDMPQDPGSAGLHQKAAISKLLNGFNFRFSPETGSKEDRAIPFAAQVEAGNVRLVDGPWVQAFLAEAAAFPKGRYKDQIDACTRAYARLLKTQADDSHTAAQGSKLIEPGHMDSDDYGSSGLGADGYWYEDELPGEDY